MKRRFLYQALFFKFLKDNKALVPFLVNLYILNKGKRNKIITFSTYQTKRFPVDYITFAFMWHNTTEGKEFWLKLDIAWLRYLETFDKRIKGKHPDTIRGICKRSGIKIFNVK